MKKVILALAIVSVSFAACNNGETKTDASADSTVKAIDSTVKVMDSTVKVVDSTVKAIDSTKK